MSETLTRPASQNDRAEAFAALHQPGDPVILFNIWDAGSAAAIAEAGASALATGSWSVAAAQGYEDGEDIPLDTLLDVARRITAKSDLPLTVDFETGFAEPLDALQDNIRRLIDTGAIGINFEDQIIGGEGLRSPDEQAGRIAAVRAAARDEGVSLFINARTDLFLKEGDSDRHGALIDDAIARAAVYAEAGASGLFVPGLADEALIARICGATALPVNVMMKPGVPSPARLAQLGTARISHGPFPYIEAMARLTERARAALT